MSNTEIRSMNSSDLILSSKWCLAFTAILLLHGLPLAATCVSAFGIMLFLFQAKSFYHSLKDLRKWVLLSGFAFVASFRSYWILELASKQEGESRSFWLWLFGTALHAVAGGFLAYCLYKDYRKEPDNFQSTVEFLEVRVRILKGRNLVAKGCNIFGKPTTSDPYVKVLHNNKYVGETAIVWKTLNPVWENELFFLPIVPKALSRCNELELVILDRHRFSKDDNMGTVMVPIPKILNQKVSGWYKVGTGSGPSFCPDPNGELQVEVEVRQLLSKRCKRQLSRKFSDHQTFPSPEQRGQIVALDPVMPAKSARKLVIPNEDELTSHTTTDEINSLNSSFSSSPRSKTVGTPNRRKAIFSPSASPSKPEKSTTRRLSSRLAKKLPRMSISPKRTKRQTVMSSDKMPQ